MAAPNVLTPRMQHLQSCRGLPAKTSVGVGDVRRCPHGKVQIAEHQIGWGVPLWFDLTIANPVLYYRARKALR